jgi:type IV pilus assembly protein PilB
MSNLTQRHIIAAELLSRGLISVEQVQEAEDRSASDGRPMLKVLVEDRFVLEEDVYRVVAESVGMPFVSLDDLQVDPSASARLTPEWARRLNVLPFGWKDNELEVATDDPTSLTLKDDILRLANAPAVLHLAPPTALTRKINQTYRAEEDLEDISDAIISETAFDFGGDSIIGGTGEDDAPIVKYVNLLLSQAVADRASDVHVEPTETELQVRYRIDGVLHKQMSSSRSILNGVVSRIKVMASMDIAERRKPQDGRMTVNLQGRKIDLRVATLPTVHGEKVVMRILDKSSAPLDLKEIGFAEHHREAYAKQYMKPNGLILVTGPTGSGKSTTLYATLNAIKRTEINIITVEDPVEFRMNGISQIQINPKADLTFAAALRSILRSDPDVVLVGEIRDKETAQMAVESALTGHLVLSSLHTNDAPSAITRLIEMGIEPFLVGSALTAVVAQRLVRRLCDKCKVEYELQPDEIEKLGYPWRQGEPLPRVYRPGGCPSCSRTGYRGRTSIHELLFMTPALERLTNEGAHADLLRKTAIEQGALRPIKEDGWEKVASGETSVEEVLRVIG